ncbi:SDR family NAD(P)-dependent oxidoreductase [Mesorhizobium sp. M6A.T.Ce.TU.016.01.1.1]|uniref:SDR family NAD(P)-dependent oxidoreductase n=1 Tax=Mesorhizobium sp. M6A.T.Ce.TU.016.01.1.1 TaxID=2496783 RepID=UPI001FE02BA0|nr:SDR family NAD(P)-dependent oxidoreductase [Mesorhizobium sp. M6A.T.Ce.TU.016.01.1.1]
MSGGTHGIGASCVRRLAAQEDALVVFTGRDEAAAREIVSSAANARFIACDVRDEAECRTVVDAAMTLGHGKIAGLVNNAGMTGRGAFEAATLGDWDEIMTVNTRSSFVFTREAMPGLRAARGSVVMMSSVAGLMGEEGLAIYSASKAALIALTWSLALEISEVRFNAVCPGQIATRMMAGTLAIPGRRALLESRVPVGRLGTPEDVAEAVAWLLSPASSFVNGIVMPVDGGESAGLKTPALPENSIG